MSELGKRLQSAGPKRILALDGGGVRGILSLAILEEVEAILRRRSPQPETFRLCDYFDLIGGTSTGSIIASGLAIGLSVGDLVSLYRQVSAKVFKRPRWACSARNSRAGRWPRSSTRCSATRRWGRLAYGPVLLS
ncbi:MAG: hypothetical protein FJX11_09130 [Alphaproteobacteria bacterium]|nr:hypothetical protein [Alphaproteobacteria bacterium]